MLSIKNFTFHYIDDVRSLNNSRFGDFVDRLYPIELEIKDTTDTDMSASYLDLHLKIDSKGWLITETFWQKRWFQFSHCELTIYMLKHSSSSCIYGVYISQLIQCSRTSGFQHLSVVFCGSVVLNGHITDQLPLLWCLTHFFVFVFVLCTLCCQFLWIIHFWLPLRYSLTSIY
jgi:hypothetical protein